MKELKHVAVDLETEDTTTEEMTKAYKLLMFRKAELEELMKIDQEEFEKMTELEWEWELFRRTEIKEKLEKWIEIKSKLDKRKTSKNATDCKD